MSVDEHVVDDLHEYALEILDSERTAQVKSHLSRCRSCLQELGRINDLLVQSFEHDVSMTPPGDLRSRLLQDVSSIAPYSLYHQQMADALGGTEAGLREELSSMPDPSTWAQGPIPHCRLFPCVAGAEPRNAIRTLVRMEQGSRFPEHEHVGDETVLIVQGSLRSEDGQVHRPGKVLRMAAGTSHGFDVPKGLDLIYLAVVEEGLKIDDQLITAETLSEAVERDRSSD